MIAVSVFVHTPKSCLNYREILKTVLFIYNFYDTTKCLNAVLMNNRDLWKYGYMILKQGKIRPIQDITSEIKMLELNPHKS